MSAILLAFALHCSSTSYVAHTSDTYTYYAYNAAYKCWKHNTA